MLYGYPTVDLSICLFVNIWIVPSFCYYKSSCYEYSCADLCVNVCPHFLAKCLGVEYGLDMV